MTDKPLSISTRFVLKALRHCGYTNYTAIDDIMDNSIDAKAKDIKFDLVMSKGAINSLIIADDGTGMNRETLELALKLGADTGKIMSLDLGTYGAGMKTASLSIGKRLDVITKSSEDEFLTATLDISDALEGKSEEILVNYKKSSKEEIETFKKYIKGDTGTTIVVSKLDKLQTEQKAAFKCTLKKNIRLVFNKFMYSGKYNFYLCGEKLVPVDPIGDKVGNNVVLLKEDKDSYGDAFFAFNGYYIKPEYGISKENDCDESFLPRTVNNSGLYIYRNNRLVGYGLNLGILSDGAKHSQNVGFRGELFLDHNADRLLGSTFTKMITEANADCIEEGFKQKLKEIFRPLVLQAQKMHKSDTKEDVKDDENEKKLLSRTTDMLNSNNFIGQESRNAGKNNKKETTPSEKKDTPKEHKKQLNPNPTKKRVDKWVEGFKLVSEGLTGQMYHCGCEDNKNWVYINRDHPFYTEIFQNLEDEAKSKMAVYLASDIEAKHRTYYFTNDVTRNVIDEYTQIISDTVRKALMN